MPCGLARVPADLSFDVDAERVSAAVYKLRVRPRRAVPHYVVVSYPTDGRFNRKKSGGRWMRSLPA